MDYEDMFREITKKLYGEDPDHRSKWKFYVKFSRIRSKYRVIEVSYYLNKINYLSYLLRKKIYNTSAGEIFNRK